MHDFFMCSYHVMFRLRWKRIKKKKKKPHTICSLYCLHIYDLETGQGHYFWYQSVDTKHVQSHAKYKDLP